MTVNRSVDKLDYLRPITLRPKEFHMNIRQFI